LKKLKKWWSGCPDAQAFARYTDGLLDDRETEAMEGHLVGCDSCREVALLSVSSDERQPSYAAVNRALIAATGRDGGAVRFLIRLKERAIEMLDATATLVPLEAAPAGALRGTSARDHTYLYSVQRGLYNIFVAFEPHVNGTVGSLDMSVSLKGPVLDAKDIVFRLAENDREVLSMHAKRGAALFDAITPGNYTLSIRENHGEIGSIQLNLTA